MDPRRTVEPVDAWEGISMALAGVEETARARAGRGAGGGGRGERREGEEGGATAPQDRGRGQGRPATPCAPFFPRSMPREGGH